MTDTSYVVYRTNFLASLPESNSEMTVSLLGKPNGVGLCVIEFGAPEPDPSVEIDASEAQKLHPLCYEVNSSWRDTDIALFANVMTARFWDTRCLAVAVAHACHPGELRVYGATPDQVADCLLWAGQTRNMRLVRASLPVN